MGRLGIGLALLAVLGLGAGCESGGGDVAPDVAGDLAITETAAPAFLPIASLATQNAGTTETMNLLAPSALRAVCSEWYDNNLCTLDSEVALAEAIADATPDLLFLQEIWIQSRCEQEGRPAEIQGAPYACAAGAGAQPERILPADYRWGCAEGYPDNCLAFREDHFRPDREDLCAARDCSAALAPLTPPCGRPGRIATLSGTSALGPTLLAVVHTNAGIESGDTLCRAEQLAALQALLETKPADTALFVAGDFNLDPTRESGEDVEAYRALLAATGLVRLPDDGHTHRVLMGDLDLVLVRGWPETDAALCEVHFPDEDATPPMFDHAFVHCR